MTLGPPVIASLVLLSAGCAVDGSPHETDGDDPDTSAPLDVGADAPVDLDVAPVVMPTFIDMATYGLHPVGVSTVTLVDETRSTPANGDEPEQARRTLVTELWYPAVEGSPYQATRDAAPASDATPWPLVVHGHGFLSTRTDSPLLTTFLASHGYVVAAPDFPLTGRGAPGGPNVLDGAEQPADMHFVRAQVLGDAALEGLVVDATRVVFMGVSLGGYSAIVGGLDVTLGPAPVAIVGLTPVTCMVDRDLLETSVPLLVVHGTSDAILPFDGHAQPLYDAAAKPKWLVALDRGTHTGFADITASLFSQVEHADSVGCDALADTLPGADEQGELFAGLGDDVLTPACPAPCEDMSTLVAAMPTNRQALLTRVVVRAFLDARVRGELGAEAFVEQGLAASEDDVSIQLDR